MSLTLKVENQTSLPDGGPLSTTIQGKGGIDIGRDAHLDWTLPDPSRTVSGRHCEIRWRDNSYWLHDTSSNGTFLMGAETRLPVPYRIRDGDQFIIGPYVVSAALQGGASDAPYAHAGPKPSYEDIWQAVGEVAQPVHAKQLKLPQDSKPVRADFLEWAVDVPAQAAFMRTASLNSGALRVPDEMDWSEGSKPRALATPAAPATPTPRRPIWGDESHDYEVVEPAASVVWPAPATPAPSPSQIPAAPVPVRPAPAAATSAVSDEQGATDFDQFVRMFARAAGLPETAFAGRDAGQLAEEIGALLRLITEHCMQLLRDRQREKWMANTSGHTTVQALANNPLKFAPTGEEALRLMLGEPSRSYLDAGNAFKQSFENLKSHQIQTYQAMQHALTDLLAEFDPAEIEKRAGDRSGFDLFGSRKAQLWDSYLMQWKMRTQGKKDSMLSAFMDYFADYYSK